MLNLAIIGRLDVIGRLYGAVAIPEAVAHEILVAGAGKPGSAALQEAGWITTHPVKDRALIELLSQELDPGEAEAVALAVERPSSLLLMDELRGRRVAARLGVKTIGVLGLLVLAKRRGYIPIVRPLVDQLMAEAGFWVGQEIYRGTLQLAEESNEPGQADRPHEPEARGDG